MAPILAIDNRLIFKYGLTQSISIKSGVSPLRIVNTQIDYDDVNIYVTSTMLANNPVLGMYRKVALNFTYIVRVHLLKVYITFTIHETI